MKNTIITLLVVAVISGGAYMLLKPKNKDTIPETKPTEVIEKTSPDTSLQTGESKTEHEKDTSKTVIGSSVNNIPITAYHFGEGNRELLFVGGIHGGYEWNTVLLAYQLIDYLKTNPEVVPKNIKITVIPVLNPDGLKKVVGATEKFSASDIPSSESTVISGRFNANNVDLNRNFDCDWSPNGVWQTKKVSGGSKAFSEPESLAMKQYIETSKPTAVVVWYSAGGGVFASSCHNGVSSLTTTLTKKFADASGYTAHQSFDFYETTGDMVNWLAKNNIPAISVLLTTHSDTEWIKNKTGIEALLNYYAK